MKTFFFFFFGGGGGGQVGGGEGGSQGGCEQRIEVFVKIKKKKLGWGREGGRGQVWGVRVDVIKELKSFWENSQKKGRYWGGGGGGGGSGWM